MKKIFLFFAFLGITLLSACDGPEGPQGPPGTNIVGAAYQISNVDFTPAGSYGIFYDLQILSSDVILVYRKSGVDNGNPVWQLIPKTYYIAEGEIDVNYDFTMNDVNIYLEANYDLALTPQYTQDQTFRIVVVPVDFAKRALDTEDYNSVITALNLAGKPIRQLN